MSLEKIEGFISSQLQSISERGVSKANEQVITGIKSPQSGYGPRYFLATYGDRAFLRMNSNSYLGLSTHPGVIQEEALAAEKYGSGPGAVRFIGGTFQPHLDLEEKLAKFHNRESALLFSSAFTTMLAVVPQFISEETLIISDELNHNCIINAIRLGKPAGKSVYAHLDMGILEKILQSGKGYYKRVLLISDGVFSMRGDYTPLDKINEICKKHEHDYEEGIITIIDDSHGVGAFGKTGRGTEEICNTQSDILVATLGKAFGVNGGYAVSSRKVTDYLKETAPMYIYSNPITPAEAAAATKALEITASNEGKKKLETLCKLGTRIRRELVAAGFEIIQGEHPIIPILIRDTEKTDALVKYLFENNILSTGLNYPVVPKGEQEIRLQVSTDHTNKDIDYLLNVLKRFQPASNWK